MSSFSGQKRIHSTAGFTPGGALALFGAALFFLSGCTFEEPADAGSCTVSIASPDKLSYCFNWDNGEFNPQMKEECGEISGSYSAAACKSSSLKCTSDITIGFNDVKETIYFSDGFTREQAGTYCDGKLSD